MFSSSFIRHWSLLTWCYLRFCIKFDTVLLKKKNENGIIIIRLFVLLSKTKLLGDNDSFFYKVSPIFSLQLKICGISVHGMDDSGIRTDWKLSHTLKLFVKVQLWSREATLCNESFSLTLGQSPAIYSKHRPCHIFNDLFRDKKYHLYTRENSSSLLFSLIYWIYSLCFLLGRPICRATEPPGTVNSRCY